MFPVLIIESIFISIYLEIVFLVRILEYFWKSQKDRFISRDYYETLFFPLWSTNCHWDPSQSFKAFCNITLRPRVRQLNVPAKSKLTDVPTLAGILYLDQDINQADMRSHNNTLMQNKFSFQVQNVCTCT